jgi:hypothetical protein
MTFGIINLLTDKVQKYLLKYIRHYAVSSIFQVKGLSYLDILNTNYHFITMFYNWIINIII